RTQKTVASIRDQFRRRASLTYKATTSCRGLGIDRTFANASGSVSDRRLCDAAVFLQILLDLSMTASAALAGARILAHIAHRAQLQTFDHADDLRLGDVQAPAHDLVRTPFAMLVERPIHRDESKADTSVAAC